MRNLGDKIEKAAAGAALLLLTGLGVYTWKETQEQKAAGAHKSPIVAPVRPQAELVRQKVATAARVEYEHDPDTDLEVPLVAVGACVERRTPSSCFVSLKKDDLTGVYSPFLSCVGLEQGQVGVPVDMTLGYQTGPRFFDDLAEENMVARISVGNDFSHVPIAWNDFVKVTRDLETTCFQVADRIEALTVDDLKDVCQNDLNPALCLVTYENGQWVGADLLRARERMEAQLEKGGVTFTREEAHLLKVFNDAGDSKFLYPVSAPCGNGLQKCWSYAAFSD